MTRRHMDDPRIFEYEHWDCKCIKCGSSWCSGFRFEPTQEIVCYKCDFRYKVSGQKTLEEWITK